MGLKELKFYYRNYKGIHSIRTVVNPVLRYGNSEYHKGVQWFLRAFDVEKDDFRDFAVVDIIHFEGDN